MPPLDKPHVQGYRVTSLIRNIPPVGPFSSRMILGWWVFLMSEVPLYFAHKLPPESLSGHKPHLQGLKQTPPL